MKHADFVHLHLHTQYSLLDGAIRPKELFERAKEYNLPALAITDHGNMFGAIDFYQTAYEYGIKPIIGCEIYVAPASRFDKDTSVISEASFHLVLLVKNQIGYKNLLNLVSKAYFEGFYYRPRVDKELLKEFNQGLIAMSSCLHGEIPYLIVHGQKDQALKTAAEYREIFDNNRFFLEIQENGIKEQNIANRGILEISKKLGIPIVATNDCHYLNKEDVMAHEALVAIRTGKTLSSPDRMKFSTEELYFKPPEMMKEIFRDYPEAIKNTIEISERCNLELTFNEPKFPSFPVEEPETPNTAVRNLARIGLAERLQKHPLKLNSDFDSLKRQYEQRLESELDLINSEGFSSYFLIVSDFVNFAKKNDIPVGPGRGSAAGSLVAYSLRITEIDPIPYGLLFERFLNPERISPPDIDMDFCMDGRDRVIEYVRNKYGNDKVAQIITFGKMKARAVVRDVGRALDMPYKDVDKIAKLIPDTLNITIDEALRLEPALRQLEEEDEKVKLLISLSRVLEGLPRHESTHAAGVVISDKPLVEYLPLCKESKGEVATQYAMDDVAKIGLIKFDFLGLKTLTVIDQALKLINRDEVKIPDINEIPLDDKETYALLSSGETEGIFQLESSGMKELISKMQPENIDDVTDLNALYRPGPLQSGMVEDYIRRRKGETNISYLVPQLKSILADTYGVILYQEQVMKIAQVLAGYSLGEADILRRAMGKKKFQEMEEQKEKFLQGTQKHKIPPKKAEEIFNLMANFAGYGFNKSHSVAYAVIAYQTAYLKAHYPVEFMAALLTCEMGNTDKVIRHIGECRERGLEVLPPDVNESQRDFIVAGKKIRFGLAAVKNVGTAAIEAIIKARDNEGPFNNIFDFCRRVDLRKVNKKVIESLIKCGAFDSTGPLRSQLWAIYEKAMEKGQQLQKQKGDKQKSLFGEAENGFSFSYDGKYPEIREWPESELLTYEKEALGFFISSHPLVSFEKELKKASNTDTKEIQNLKDGAEAKIGGVPVALNEIKTKRGDIMAFVTLEDLNGSIEVIVFAELYKKVSPIIKSEQPILVKGKVTMDTNNQKSKVKAEEISLLADVAKVLPSTVHFSLDLSLISKPQLEKLKNILKHHPGKCAAFLHLLVPGRSETIISLPEELHLNPSDGLSKEVEYLFGSQVMTFD
ncbi:MAG: DNA polymerase III subunit alpha [Thermodesulfobacteriota bacterium]|jgi:DNA polymerase-3 subunit alpha|nr:MAG: DNA polymerase III subunit alpha [Thermodesulfobacteriota bacterium]